jgi:putative alpha-1,2-mannosidase
MVGTFAPGFTVPGASTPFGMTQVSPDTGGPVAYSGYSWHDPTIQGFSHVHLSGPGVKKAGDIPLMPTVGPVTSSEPRAYAASYDHATEKAEPGFYGVQLGSGVEVELTATTRTGMQRYTFPPVPQANVLLDVSRSVEGVHQGHLEVVDADTVRGWARGRYPVFFEADFSRPFTAHGTWSGSALSPGSATATGKGVGGWVSFDALTQREVTVRVGISFVDAEGAALNLAGESPDFDLDRMRTEARDAWNAELAKVQVEGGTPVDQRTFYTALYHSLLHPNVFNDVDGRYLGFDDQVHSAEGRTQYANFSSWDTYKAQNQLLASVWPDRYRDMLLSLLADARQGGHLPRWGEQNLDAAHMSGDPVVPMVADGYCRGVLDDVDPAELADLYAELEELVERREPAWHDKGYLPLQTSTRGAGTTLEYGVADFALALMADGLGRSDDAARLASSRSTTATCSTPRHAGSARATTTAAGSRRSTRRTTRPASRRATPGSTPGSRRTTRAACSTHGRRRARRGAARHALQRAGRRGVPVAVAEAQSRATLFGLVYRTNQYAPGNEHDLQTSWMYAHAGQPSKVQSVQRQIQGAFRPTVDGLPGNDDLGSLSAWYVWSALGLGRSPPARRSTSSAARLREGRARPARQEGRRHRGARRVAGGQVRPVGDARRAAARLVVVDAQRAAQGRDAAARDGPAAEQLGDGGAGRRTAVAVRLDPGGLRMRPVTRLSAALAAVGLLASAGAAIASPVAAPAPLCDQAPEPARWTADAAPDAPVERMSLMVHRGAAELAPENTLWAFRYAIAYDVEWIEVDVQQTLDHRYVAFHDPTLDAKTDGSGPVAAKTFAELRALNAADNPTWKGSAYDPAQLPSLEEVLQLAAEEGVGVAFDLKESVTDTASVALMAAQHGLIEESVFQPYVPGPRGADQGGGAERADAAVEPGLRGAARGAPRGTFYAAASGVRRLRLRAARLRRRPHQRGARRLRQVIPNVYQGAVTGSEAGDLLHARALGADGAQINLPDVSVDALDRPVADGARGRRSRRLPGRREHRQGLPGKTLVLGRRRDRADRVAGCAPLPPGARAGRVRWPGDGSALPSSVVDAPHQRQVAR